MGKRLIRIFEAEIPDKLPSLLGKEIHLVLKNDVTLHGKVLKLEKDFLYFQDMILRKHKIQITDLAQILKDEVSSW